MEPPLPPHGGQVLLPDRQDAQEWVVILIVMLIVIIVILIVWVRDCC